MKAFVGFTTFTLKKFQVLYNRKEIKYCIKYLERDI